MESSVPLKQSRNTTVIVFTESYQIQAFYWIKATILLVTPYGNTIPQNTVNLIKFVWHCTVQKHDI